MPDGLGKRARDAEVGDHRVTRLEEDVLGLDVAMHHALAVGVGQGVGHLARDADGVVDGELLLALEPGAEGFALDDTA